MNKARSGQCIYWWKAGSKMFCQHNTLSKNNSLTHSHLVARRRATTRSFHSLLPAINAAISLASKKKNCRKWWIGKSNSFYKEANSVSDRRLWLAIRDSNPSLATCWICSRVLPSSNPRLATLVNSQLNASCQLGFLIFLCCIWINHF